MGKQRKYIIQITNQLKHSTKDNVGKKVLEYAYQKLEGIAKEDFDNFGSLLTKLTHASCVLEEQEYLKKDGEDVEGTPFYLLKPKKEFLIGWVRIKGYVD